MRFCVLGALEVEDEARHVRLGGAKERGLLALLLLHANELVSRDVLVDGLWGAQPPASARHSLEAYMSRLRKALGNGELIESRAGGYVLRLDPARLDLTCFERLLDEGQAALAEGFPERAARKLGEALALWHGDPLADLATEPFASTEIVRLEELRLTALEARIEAELSLGRHAELVADLEALLAAHPLRERLRRQLMLALYRSGRQAEALEVYREGRRQLVDELGIEPGKETRDLERAILAHEPGIDLSPPRPTEGRAGERPSSDAAVARATPAWRSRRVVASALAVVALGIALAALRLTGGGTKSIVLRPGTVGVIEPATNRIVSSVPVGRSPTALAAGAGAVWVLDVGDSTVVRVDPRRNAVAATIALARAGEKVSLGGIAAGYGAVWVTEVADGRLTLDQIGTALNSIAATVPLGSSAADTSAPVAVGGGAVWVADYDGRLVSIDPRTTRRVTALDSGPETSDLAVGADAVWLASWDGVTPFAIATRIRGRPTPLGTFARPRAVAVGAGGVWVTIEEDDAVARIDPSTQTVKTIPVGDGPVDVAVGAGAVWVANRFGSTVSRIDPVTMKVVATIPLGASPSAVAVADDHVWVAAGWPLAVRKLPLWSPQHASPARSRS